MNSAPEEKVKSKEEILNISVCGTMKLITRTRVAIIWIIIATNDIFKV